MCLFIVASGLAESGGFFQPLLLIAASVRVDLQRGLGHYSDRFLMYYRSTLTEKLFPEDRAVMLVSALRNSTVQLLFHLPAAHIFMAGPGSDWSWLMYAGVCFSQF